MIAADIIERGIAAARAVAASTACTEARKEARGNKWPHYFEWAAEDDQLLKRSVVRTPYGELQLPVRCVR